jgi:hypothetical protein
VRDLHETQDGQLLPDRRTEIPAEIYVPHYYTKSSPLVAEKAHAETARGKVFTCALSRGSMWHGSSHLWVH